MAWYLHKPNAATQLANTIAAALERGFHFPDQRGPERSRPTGVLTRILGGNHEKRAPGAVSLLTVGLPQHNMRALSGRVSLPRRLPLRRLELDKSGRKSNYIEE